MGIQPDARFPAQSADALPATLLEHFIQAIYRNRPIVAFEFNLRRYTSGPGPPPAHTVAPSGDPVAMIMPPKAGLRELGKPKFETGATLSEKYKVRPPHHIPSARVNYKLSSCQLV
jgi:hypothetical protein